MDKVCVLVFSKNRAMQLDATIRSYDRHVQGEDDDADRVVLYTTTSEIHEAQYDILQRQHRRWRFVRQGAAFQSDLRRILKPAKHALFLVDDAIFVATFRVHDLVEKLGEIPDAIGVSLRLGRNITRCYPIDQPVPPVLLHDLGDGLCIYPWPGAPMDFGYPLEVSSSLYRTEDVWPVLDGAMYDNPNALESALDAYKGTLLHARSSLICFETSRAFCAPMNMVQTVVQNRAATSPAYSAEALAQRFELGERIDISRFDGAVPSGCHQEVDLLQPSTLTTEEVPSEPVARLAALKTAYAGIVDHSFWGDFQSTIDVQRFRGESHYLSQLAYGASPEQYHAEFDYVRSRVGDRLYQVVEDGAFGCVTFRFDGKMASRDLLDSLLEISFIHDALGLSTSRTILDIGAGYGRLAHRLLELFPDNKVYCYDAVPISTLLSEVYLRHRGVDDRAKVVPLHQIEQLTPASVDLACNVHSWSECTLQSINFWLDFLADHNVPNLFVVPHTDAFLTREHDDSRRRSFLPAIQAHGFTLARQQPKYPEGVAGAFPTRYYWFTRERTARRSPPKTEPTITSATHGDSAYLDVCDRAAAAGDDSVFSIFKSLPAYRAVLEHVTYEQGAEYLKHIDLDAVALASLAVNDVYGCPAKYSYPAVGVVSPTTLRYAKVACDLRKHFDGVRTIAEIGVGYGGQSLVLSKLAPTDSYYAIDLPPVLRLVDKYLSRLSCTGTTLVDATDAAAVADVPAVDLVVSNYAFSECSQAVRDHYVDTVIRKSKRGYLTLNHLDTSAVHNLVLQIESLGKTVSIMREEPSTADGNCILIYRPKATAPEFHSQAGQDRFVHALAVAGEGRTSGTFLDVGCSDPVLLSNTLALESIGWRGALFDINPGLKGAIAEKRRSPFICGDVRHVDWDALFDEHKLPHIIDYLSFDLDDAGVEILPTLPWSRIRFRILTVEHDAYRFGDKARQTMRAFLRSQGYELLCPDVSNGGTPFEDWWVDPKLVDMAVANRFRTTSPTEGRCITEPASPRVESSVVVTGPLWTPPTTPSFTVAMATPLSAWNPARVKSFEQLKQQLGTPPSWVTPTRIVSHERTHMAAWFKKAVDWFLQQDATYSLLLQDDARVSPKFFEHLQHMLVAKPDKVISLYTIHPGAQKTFEAGLRWVASMDIIPGVAWVLPTRILREMRAWEEAALRPGYEARMPEDGRLGLYCAAHNIPIWQPLPTIVNHRAPSSGMPSTYGNDALDHRNASFTWEHMTIPDRWEPGARALWYGRGFIETPLFFARNVRDWDDETMAHIENGSHPALRGAPALDLVPRPDLPDDATTSSRS